MNKDKVALGNDESEAVENKTVSLGKLPQDIWEPITAFSNADGGFINLGIDQYGNRAGVEKVYHDQVQRDFVSCCKSVFNQKIYPDISIATDNVIQIYIPPAPAALRPIFSSKRGLPKGAKVRVGTANVQVDDEWIKRFAIAARGGAELIEFEGDYSRYFDAGNIEAYLKIIKERRGDVYAGLDNYTILCKLRALAKAGNKMTLFGLLAFSNDYGLQELTAPTVNVAVTQYAGTTKVDPVDAERVSIDDREFAGNIPSQFEEALRFIKSKLPVRSRIGTEGKRLDYLAIPEVALRETLANALAHRDYTTYCGRVQVDIYADRLEFTNPGQSLVPLAQLESAHPQTRNPLLMSFLRDLHITEHRGRGITTIKSSLRKAGLSEPTFEHRHDWFVATLYSSAFIKDEDQIWLQKFSRFNLKEQQLNALVFARHEKNGINNSEYRNINHKAGVGDDIRAKKELAELVSMGLFVKIGNRRYTRYLLSPLLNSIDLSIDS